MALTIRLATPSDAASISVVRYQALEELHAFYSAFLKLDSWEVFSITTIAELEHPQHQYTVAEEGGKIIGFVGFQVIRDERPVQEVSGMKAAFRPKEDMKKLWAEFTALDSKKDGVYEKLFGQKKHIFVKHLMVLPERQRGGIGTALLQTVLQQGQKLGVGVYLIASSNGVRLYEKLGFQETGIWEIDNEAWARRIVERMEEVGLKDDGNLVERYKGVKEIERSMVWWPDKVEL